MHERTGTRVLTENEDASNPAGMKDPEVASAEKEVSMSVDYIERVNLTGWKCCSEGEMSNVNQSWLFESALKLTRVDHHGRLGEIRKADGGRLPTP